MREPTRLCRANLPSEWTNGSVRFTLLHLNENLMARLGIESWAAFQQEPGGDRKSAAISWAAPKSRNTPAHIWYRTLPGGGIRAPVGTIRCPLYRTTLNAFAKACEAAGSEAGPGLFEPIRAGVKWHRFA